MNTARGNWAPYNFWIFFFAEFNYKWLYLNQWETYYQRYAEIRSSILAKRYNQQHTLFYLQIDFVVIWN